MCSSDLLDNIHPTTGIFQGDFIGFGGDFTFCPNTITYDFPEEVNQEIIIAPHTYYIADKDLRDAVAFPMEFDLESDENVLFVKPDVYIEDDREDIIERCNFARQISTICEYPESKKQIAHCYHFPS